MFKCLYIYYQNPKNNFTEEDIHSDKFTDDDLNTDEYGEYNDNICNKKR